MERDNQPSEAPEGPEPGGDPSGPSDPVAERLRAATSYDERREILAPYIGGLDEAVRASYDSSASTPGQPAGRGKWLP